MAVATRAMLAEEFWSLRFGIALQKGECACGRDTCWGVGELYGPFSFDFCVCDGSEIALRLGRTAVVIVVPGQACQHACADKEGKCPNDIESMAQLPTADERHNE